MNAASLGNSPYFASREILSIFGQNLAPAAVIAGTTVLPFTLAGTSVTVNGVPCPLFYVSPTQINFQMPSNFISDSTPLDSTRFPLIVRSLAGTSSETMLFGTFDSPGLFTQGATGCGPGAIQNVSASRIVSLNSHENSVSPGDFISVFGTGSGFASPPPPDGAPALQDPLSRFTTLLRAELGLDGFVKTSIRADFAGPAPGLIGVDQMNFQIPQDAIEGCDVPIALKQQNSGQTVTLNIRRGGGVCMNSPIGRAAHFRWVKTMVSDPAFATIQTADRLLVNLAEAPRNLLALTSPSRLPDPVTLTPVHEPRFCGESVPNPADAGLLTLTGVNGLPPVILNTSVQKANLSEVLLPTGSIGPGVVSVSGAGASIGPFSVPLSIPAPIEITTSLGPGTTFSIHNPIRITWKNGAVGNMLVLRIDYFNGFGPQQYQSFTAFAAAGELVVPVMGSGNMMILPLPPADSVAFTIKVYPSTAQTFTAKGLDFGQAEWSYEYVYRGLRISGI